MEHDTGGSGPKGSPLPTPPSPRASFLRVLFWVALLMILLPVTARMFAPMQADVPITYSAFLQQVRDGNVKTAVIKGTRITGELRHAIAAKAESVTEPAAPAPAAEKPATANGESAPAGKGNVPGGEASAPATATAPTHYRTYVPDIGDDALLPLLEKNGVTIGAQPQSDSSWWLILGSALPFVLFLGIGYFLIRKMKGQGQQMFSMGKSRAKLYQRTAERTTFDDVAGADGAKNELREIIDFLSDPARFRRLGGKPPKGVLLVGAPGTGKTLLARASAGEAGVPFFSISGSDFMEMFVGVGASRVRDLFGEARRSAPAIIFIDEIDSIGRTRGAGIGGGHDEREQTLNQLLSEMDGFEPTEGIIVMAATNRPDILDPALLRPGRFDRRVTVDLPGVQARKAILEVHARNKPMADDVDLGEVARSAPGFSGADLENLLNEAALLAVRKKKDSIASAEIEEARDKILLGLEREGLALTPAECRLIAYHEGGHAVVAAVLPNTDPLHKVTIVPRGHAMGVTEQLPERDRYIYPIEYLEDRMAVMMGGRAAEVLVLGSPTSGAENDLKEAVRLARKMVLDWGMSERLGPMALGSGREHVFLGEQLTQGREYSEHTAREVDEEVRAITAEAYRRAMEVLTKYRKGLDAVVEQLLKHEELTGKQVTKILGVDRRQHVEAPLPHDRAATA